MMQVLHYLSVCPQHVDCSIFGYNLLYKITNLWLRESADIWNIIISYYVSLLLLLVSVIMPFKYLRYELQIHEVHKILEPNKAQH